MSPQVPHTRASKQHTLSKAVSRTIAQGRAKPLHLESQWLWSVTQLAGFKYQLINMISGMRCEFSRPSSLALLYQMVTPKQPIQMEEFLQSLVSSILQLMEDERERALQDAPGTWADSSRPAEMQVIDFNQEPALECLRTSLLCLYFWCPGNRRTAEALAAAKCSVWSRCVIVS